MDTRGRLVIDAAANASLHLAFLPKDFEPGSTGGPFGSLPGGLLRGIEEADDPAPLRVRARNRGRGTTPAAGRLDRPRRQPASARRGGDRDRVTASRRTDGGGTVHSPPRSEGDATRTDPLELALQVADQPTEAWPKTFTRMGPRIGLAAAADAIARALSESPGA